MMWNTLVYGALVSAVAWIAIIVGIVIDRVRLQRRRKAIQ